MKHEKIEHYLKANGISCKSSDLFLSGGGLQCGNCLAIDFFNTLTEEQKKAYIEDIEKTYKIKLDPETGKKIK